MLTQLKQASNHTYTENEALTYKSSGNYCLDFFATAGALRNADRNSILERYIRAFAESREYAMKTLFFARDIRGGLGERRLFRIILRYLAHAERELLIRNIPIIAEYGRYDDLLVLIGTKCEAAAIGFIRSVITADIDKMRRGQPVSLLAKWLPSVNTSSMKQRSLARIIAKRLHWSHEEYRKNLSALRTHIDVLEKRLCNKDYSFEYEIQPSKALFKYRAAFNRNDAERYKQFLTDVSGGHAELKTGSLYPYDIVRRCSDGQSLDENERLSLDVTWKALEDYTDGRNALVVVDGSGSMYGDTQVRPIDVAVSLGIYFAQRNSGAFKNHFITFSESPRLIEIKGRDIAEQVAYCMSFNEIANTNLFKTLMLILDTAVSNRLPQDQLPEMLYIISDMEFDSCADDADRTVYEYAKELFEEKGYKMPNVIFWNVDSRQEQQPVSMHETGVALVSGMSPILFKMVVCGDIDPLSFMKNILDSGRYDKVVWNLPDDEAA